MYVHAYPLVYPVPTCTSLCYGYTGREAKMLYPQTTSNDSNCFVLGSVQSLLSSNSICKLIRCMLVRFVVFLSSRCIAARFAARTSICSWPVHDPTAR